ncbi:MAG: hypothetical protein JTT13_00775 [Candidatus Brockarchaeota archaeon]|nr:hypothetical protein [Candidatus Brockarchaeota archaeon]
MFWNPEEKLFFMLVCATTNDGPVAKRGCVGLAKSHDLEKWECHPPFYAPNICGPMECPDLFQLGGRWYLVFSEFTENLQTHYRVADDFKGFLTCSDTGCFKRAAFLRCEDCWRRGKEILIRIGSD